MADARIYGRNPVLELLRAHGRRADEIAVLAGARGPLAATKKAVVRKASTAARKTRDVVEKATQAA